MNHDLLGAATLFQERLALCHYEFRFDFLLVLTPSQRSPLEAFFCCVVNLLLHVYGNTLEGIKCMVYGKNHNHCAEKEQYSAKLVRKLNIYDIF